VGIPSSGATSKVLFLRAPTHYKISDMDDIADPHQADKIARAYLKQLRQQDAGIGEKIQAPGLQAWQDAEKRLMLSPLPNEPKEPNEGKVRTPRQTTAIKRTKKGQSIWKRPISELWR
jgi:hypothetical protein